MAVEELIGFIERYAEAATRRENADRSDLRLPGRRGLVVTTTDGTGEAEAVCWRRAPSTARTCPPSQRRYPTSSSRSRCSTTSGPRAAQGRVLVVGASATGLQIGDELLRSGREVTVAVGEHVACRGCTGAGTSCGGSTGSAPHERYDEVDDLVRARDVPSPQLVGTPDHADLDLNALTSRGAELVGRLSAVRDGHALFCGSLRNVCNLADLKLVRLLDTIDACAAAEGLADDPIARPHPTRVPDAPRLDVDLVAGGYETVLWATGFRSDYSWLEVPVLDRKGELRHDGGIVRDAPGLYRIGLNFLRRRKSSFIHGARTTPPTSSRTSSRTSARNQDIPYQLCVVC